jgi:hypothetical protein
MLESGKIEQWRGLETGAAGEAIVYYPPPDLPVSQSLVTALVTAMGNGWDARGREGSEGQ